jgi:hypothetical protein
VFFFFLLHVHTREWEEEFELMISTLLDVICSRLSHPLRMFVPNLVICVKYIVEYIVEQKERERKHIGLYCIKSNIFCIEIDYKGFYI